MKVLKFLLSLKKKSYTLTRALKLQVPEPFLITQTKIMGIQRYRGEADKLTKN